MQAPSELLGTVLPIGLSIDGLRIEIGTHTPTNTYTHIHAHTHTHTQHSYTHECTLVGTHTYARAHTHMRTHTCTREVFLLHELSDAKKREFLDEKTLPYCAHTHEYGMLHR